MTFVLGFVLLADTSVRVADATSPAELLLLLADASMGVADADASMGVAGADAAMRVASALIAGTGSRWC